MSEKDFKFMRRSCCSSTNSTMRAVLYQNTFITALLIMVFLVLAELPSNAVTYYVKTNGNDSDTIDGKSWVNAKQTISKAIEKAAAGDQIWIASGTYNERITLKSGVALYGGFAGTESTLGDRPSFPRRSPDSNETVIDGSGAGSVVTVPSAATASTIIDGFTIRNGIGTVNGSYRYGGGIYCSGTSSTSLTISNNIIKNCTAAYGAGIYLTVGSTVVTKNNISSNTASQSGGGIYCNGTCSITLNTIQSNQSTSSTGAGIYCSANATIAGNMICRNIGGSTGAYGMAIACQSCSPAITNNTISDNTNSYYSSAGAIYCYYSPGTISNNIIAYNTMGIVCYYTGTKPTLSYNNVYSNTNGNYYSISAGSTDVSYDPKFVSRQSGSYDYHLQGTSKCIDRGNGNASGVPTVDIDGASRVYGGTIDIGADEYIGALPSPMFSPGSGTVVYGNRPITISSSVPNTVIRYTNDGTDPTPSSGSVYSGSVTLTSSNVLKAIACKSGWDASAVSSATYTKIPVTTDVAMDSNNDGVIDAADELVEMTSGCGEVKINSDDDNNNNTLDNLEVPGHCAEENDLVELKINYSPLNEPDCGLAIYVDTDNIKLWSSKYKDTLLSSNGPDEIIYYLGDYINHPTWYNEVPTSIWVEGVSAGSSVISLVFYDLDGNPVSMDEARVNVVTTTPKRVYTIEQALGESGSTNVTIAGAAVSARFAPTNGIPSYCYVQQTLNESTYGVRLDVTGISQPAGGYEVGSDVTITGQLSTNTDGERVITVSEIGYSNPDSHMAVVTPTPPTTAQLISTVCGPDFGVNTLSINDYPSPEGTPYNVGTLTRVRGFVRSIDETNKYVFVDDGTIRGSQADGLDRCVRVDWCWDGNPTSYPSVGDYIEVTGVASIRYNGFRHRAIKTWSDSNYTILGRYGVSTAETARSMTPATKVVLWDCLAISGSTDFTDGIYVKDGSGFCIKVTGNTGQVARLQAVYIAGTVSSVNNEPVIQADAVLTSISPTEVTELSAEHVVLVPEVIADGGVAPSGRFIAVTGTVTTRPANTQIPNDSKHVWITFDGDQSLCISSAGLANNSALPLAGLVSNSALPSATIGSSVGVKGILSNEPQTETVCVRVRDTSEFEIFPIGSEPDWPPYQGGCCQITDYQFGLGSGQGEPANGSSGYTYVSSSIQMQFCSGVNPLWKHDIEDIHAPYLNTLNSCMSVDMEYTAIGKVNGKTIVIPKLLSSPYPYDGYHRTDESSIKYDGVLDTRDLPSGNWTIKAKAMLYDDDELTDVKVKTIQLNGVNNLKISQWTDQAEPRLFYYNGQPNTTGGFDILATPPSKSGFDRQPDITLTDALNIPASTKVTAIIYPVDAWYKDGAEWKLSGDYCTADSAVVGNNDTVTSLVWNGKLYTPNSFNAKDAPAGIYCYILTAEQEERYWIDTCTYNYSDVPMFRFNRWTYNPPARYDIPSVGSDWDCDTAQKIYTGSERLEIEKPTAQITKVRSNGDYSVKVCYYLNTAGITYVGHYPDPVDVRVTAYDQYGNKLKQVAGTKLTRSDEADEHQLLNTVPIDIPHVVGRVLFVVSAQEGEQPLKYVASPVLSAGDPDPLQYIDRHGRQLKAREQGVWMSFYPNIHVTADVDGVFLKGAEFTNKYRAKTELLPLGGKIRFKIGKDKDGDGKIEESEDGADTDGDGTIEDSEYETVGIKSNSADGAEQEININELPSDWTVKKSILRVEALDEEGNAVLNGDGLAVTDTIDINVINMPAWMFTMTAAKAAFLGHITYDIVEDRGRKELVYHFTPDGLTFQNISSQVYTEDSGDIVGTQWGGRLKDMTGKESYNATRGKYEGEFNLSFYTEEMGKKTEAWRYKNRGGRKKMIYNWNLRRAGEGEARSTMAVNAKVESEVSPSPGSSFISSTVDVSGQFGMEYEFKRMLGTIWCIPIWAVGKVWITASPTVTFDIESLVKSLGPGAVPEAPFTSFKIPIEVGGEGKAEAGVPDVIGVYGGLRATVNGTPYVGKTDLPVCLDIPHVSNLSAKVDWFVGAECPWDKAELSRTLWDRTCQMSQSSPSIFALGYGNPTQQNYPNDAEPLVYVPASSIMMAEPDIVTPASGDTDTELIQSICAQGDPSVASYGDSVLLATTNRTNSLFKNRLDIYATIKTEGQWDTSLSQLTNNGNIPDILPTTAFDSSGVPIVAWVTVPGFYSSDPIDVTKSKMDIAYASYDAETATWYQSSLTTNSVMDINPMLVKGVDGSLSLVWMQSSTNSLPLPGDPSVFAVGNANVMISHWTGGSFSTPSILASGIDTTGAFSYGRDATGREYLAWLSSEDPSNQNYKNTLIKAMYRENNIWSSSTSVTPVGGYTGFSVITRPTGTQIAYVSAGTGGNLPDDPWDQFITRTFNGTGWSAPQVQFESELMLGLDVTANGDDATCVWAGISQDNGNQLYYSKCVGNSAWQRPQALSTEYLPGFASCALSNTGFRVAYMYDSTPTVYMDNGYRIRYLEHSAYTDLQVGEKDIKWNPDTQQVSVKVHLMGDYNAQSVTVALYDGNPSSGTLIHCENVDIDAGGTAGFTTSWTYPTDGQLHRFWVVVDPSNQIDESDETNNTANRLAGNLDVNLQVGKMQIGDYNGDTLTVSFPLSNSSESTASYVPYELMIAPKTDDDPGVTIASGLVPAVSGASPGTVSYGTASATFDTSLIPIGEHDLVLILGDKDGEQDLEDTTWSVPATVRFIPDLAVMAPWTFEDTGNTKVVSVTVKNLGTRKSDTTTIKLLCSGGGLTYTSNVPPIAPGEIKTIDIDVSSWNYGLDTARVWIDATPQSDMDTRNNEITVTVN